MSPPLLQVWSSLMLLIISCDRLVLVSAPLYYINHQSHKHTMRIILAAYILAGATVAVFVFYVLTEIPDTETPRICLALSVFSDAKGFYTIFVSYYHQHGPQYFAYLSVFVYCIVWPVHMSGRGKILPTVGDAQRQRKVKAQRKMTKTLGICCLCTLLLYIVPAELANVLWGLLGFPNGFSHLLWVLTQTNSLATIAIYQGRHPELRTAMNGLLKDKLLPPSLELWPVPQ